MSKGRTTKTRLGLLAAVVLGLFAFVVAPAPAVAAGNNYGGLEFEFVNAPGVTAASISIDSKGIVTVDGGNQDMIVTQTDVGLGPTTANAIVIGNTNAYTGTITLNGVKIGTADHPTHNDADATIEFNNPAITTGKNATVVLGEGTVIQGNGTDPAILMGTNNNNSDNLVIQGGAQVNGAVVANGSTTAAFSAISVGGTGNPSITFENGGGSISGGESASVGAINYTGTKPGELDIVVNDSAMVTGVATETPYNTPALSTNSTGTGTILLTGTSSISFNGCGTGAVAAASGIYFATGATLNVGDYLDPGCTVQVNGGNGAPISSGGDEFAGGSGITFNAAASLAVNSGTLVVNGGAGGAVLTGASATDAGNAGHAIDLASTTGSVTISGGTVQLTGGTGGKVASGITGNQGHGGTGIYGAGGVNSTFTVEYDPDMSDVPPTVTVIGGQGSVYTGTGQAVYGVGNSSTNLNVGVSIDETPAQGSTTPTYKWVAYTNSVNSAPTAKNKGVLQGFAGMDADQEDEMQASFGANPYLVITQAPLESVAGGVSYSANGEDPNQSTPFVVAQTVNTMSGILAEPDWTYAPSIAATFEGLTNVSCTNFDTLAGMDDLNDFTFAPEANVSTRGMSGNNFFVPETATGNQLTVTPGSQTGLPANLAKVYPDLSVTPGTVNIVYTVIVNNGTGDNVGTIAPGAPGTGSGSGPVMVYTAQDGSGSLVTGSAPNATNSPLTTQIIAPSAPATSGEDFFIGLFNETGTTPVQVSNTKLTGWDSNAVLTAEWGAMDLVSVAPTPVVVEQGNSVEATATYTLTPDNDDIQSYSLTDAGVVVPWKGVFVSTHFGEAEPNGVTVAQTSSNTATGPAPMTITSVATISANGTADTGQFRVWPTIDNVAPTTTVVDPNSKYVAVNVQPGSGEPTGEINVIRMYNPNNGEHLYTTDPNEAETLENTYGWDNENVAWVAPTSSSTPIYRLYNPFNGDHLYTTSKAEYDALKNINWRGEGIKLYSANNTDVPIYRLFNSHMTANGGAYAHLWTADYNEYVTLWQRDGWSNESVAFYALSAPQPPAN